MSRPLHRVRDEPFVDQPANQRADGAVIPIGRAFQSLDHLTGRRQLEAPQNLHHDPFGVGNIVGQSHRGSLLTNVITELLRLYSPVKSNFARVIGKAEAEAARPY
jgi:hypothetical protein